MIQIVSVIAIVILGGFIVASKWGAKGLHAPRSGEAAPSASVSAAEAEASVPASASAIAAPSAEAAASPSGSAAPEAAAVPKGPKDKRNAADKPQPDLPAIMAAAVHDAVAKAMAEARAADSKPSPLDDASEQTEEDFPKDLSDEEKVAIGTGKVPIHREGAYKSPLASPKLGGPAHVKVGLVVSKVREYTIQTGLFLAEFFLSMTSDKPMPTITLEFTNGRDEECKVLADTVTFKLFRCGGTFQSPVDVRKYPFDTQHLTIEIEDSVYGVDAVVFEPDPARTSLDEGFFVAGYGVASVGAHAFKHGYPARFDRDDLYVSRYKFDVGIDRFATSAAFSVFVPAFIIVLISLFGLWVPPSELEVRANAGAPMLAAAVLFHYSLIQSLPATGYLTRADKLMLSVYVCLLLNIATTWVFLIVKEANVDQAFRIARFWGPVASAGIMALGVFI